MSHNNNKIGDSSPNIQGDVTVNFGDLSDVSVNSPVDGEVIQYKSASSSWEAVSAPGGQIQYIWAGAKLKAYSNSPATSSTSGRIYIWDDAPINTISGATINLTSGNANADENNWIETITLPAGKYMLRAQTMFEFTASGYASYYWRYSNTYITNLGVVGENRGTNNGPSNSMTSGYYNFTQASTIQLYHYTNSNVDTVANQGNTPSEFGLIYIEKLS